jgi:transcriptional regulator with XRE-family HTH domain
MPRNDENWTTLEDLAAKWASDPEHLLAEFRVKSYFVVAQDVFELRQEMGLTQEQLAERAQTHQSRISKIESAELDPKLSTLIKIAEALDAHVDIQLVKNLIETAPSGRSPAESESLTPRTTAHVLKWSGGAAQIFSSVIVPVVMKITRSAILVARSPLRFRLFADYNK